MRRAIKIGKFYYRKIVRGIITYYWSEKIDLDVKGDWRDLT